MLPSRNSFAVQPVNHLRLVHETNNQLAAFGMATNTPKRRTLSEAPGILSIGRKPFDGNIEENVISYLDHFAQAGEKEEDFDYQTRNENTTDIVLLYYTLATDLYEYGYGESFHFAPVKDELSFSECIADYEREIAKTLNARPGMKILDIGCGVGGPAREIAHHSGANIVGLNICDYQLKRARELTEKAGLTSLVSYVKGDYCNMDFPNNTFDGLYALASTAYAKSPVDVYKEVYRVLKPGALFVDSAWAMTDNYDPNNPGHVKIKADIEYGNGIAQLKSQQTILAAMREAGLEVIGFQNCHHEGDRPWNYILTGQHVCSIQNFYTSIVGRWTTHTLLWLLETIRVVPQGTCKVNKVLLTAASGLAAGGKADIFTPMFRIVARKPQLSTT